MAILTWAVKGFAKKRNEKTKKVRAVVSFIAHVLFWKAVKVESYGEDLEGLWRIMEGYGGL
jgi:hypothetical protein